MTGARRVFASFGGVCHSLAMADPSVIKFFENGPICVREPCKLVDQKTGREIVPKRFPVYLCRCGASQRKPFCDGAHNARGFDGTCHPTADE